MAAVRGLGFAVSGMVAGQPWAVPLVYAVPLLAIGFFGAMAVGLARPRVPRALAQRLSAWADTISQRLADRFAEGRRA
jgi:hypothetical protein